jgi:hypothetical protein
MVHPKHKRERYVAMELEGLREGITSTVDATVTAHLTCPLTASLHSRQKSLNLVGDSSVYRTVC